MKQPSIHFTSIGGSVTHSLAISLQDKGYLVTGSDDAIYDPSRSKLEKAGLLPETIGWNPSLIHKALECVILGMHARRDNPELQRAIELKIPIYSYPEFITRFCAEKHRIVITGSHGKTTTTALIMHVLNAIDFPFDYLVGAEVPGFEHCLRLSNAPTIIIEGDEYPSSALNLEPKFLQYNHHIGVLTGISWDHLNYYPTEDDYLRSFQQFADRTPRAGTLIYNARDARASKISKQSRYDVYTTGYKLPKHKKIDDITYLTHKSNQTPLSVFGDHNLLNISAAKKVLDLLYVPESLYYPAISTFKGASKRSKCLYKDDSYCIYLDYAHAPSKVLASTSALKKQFPDRRLSAILELHTFSSLDPRFTSQYRNTLKDAELAIIYINPKVLKDRQNHTFTQEYLQKSFNHPNLHLVEDKDALFSALRKYGPSAQSYLFMSSGTFGGLSFEKSKEHIIDYCSTATETS